MRKKIPVFVYKKNHDQVGNGIYEMGACFVSLGVHVSFAFEAHSENEYLQGTPGPAVACDGSCKLRNGHVENFAGKRHHTDYAVKPIVDAARAFKS